MKLKFKQQQYQDDAVMSVVNCFLGQEKGNRKDLLARYTKITDKGSLFEKKEDIEVISFGNHTITLTESERRANIRNIQRMNDINYTDSASLNDFTIEMETGERVIIVMGAVNVMKPRVSGTLNKYILCIA